MPNRPFWGVLIAVILFMMIPAPAVFGMEEKNHTYLYDEYLFPPDENGGILLALTYIVPSSEAAKGLEAVIESVFNMVATRRDLERGVKEFMIQILLYPEGSILLCELSVQELMQYLWR